MGVRGVIADDDAQMRVLIRKILENNGYEVVGEAEDGMDAVCVCRKQKPDFVIMDIHMPVMTGLEATRVIKEEKLGGFIIILTADRGREVAEKAVNLDVMGYVMKPLDEDTLIPAVKIAQKEYAQIEAMKREYTKAKETLEDRKYLDRAKGILMEHRNLTEKEAFTYIRRLAMNKGLSLAEISKMLLKAHGA